MSRSSSASITPISPRSSSLYESDFHAWTEQQAHLLRSGDLDQADLAHLAEEIETLGRSERASLKSAYRLVALHLLKMIVQKERRSRSWLGTIARERSHVAGLLDENPSLKSRREEIFAAAYRDARKEAKAETGLPIAAFPAEPPFTLAEVEDEDYLPEARSVLPPEG